MKKKPTKAEREHMGRVAALGCIVTLLPSLDRRCGRPAECHHIRHQVGAGRRSSHFQTIPLCPEHHRLGNHGIAFHAGKVVWEKRFGTELQLLDQTRQLLGETEC